MRFLHYILYPCVSDKLYVRHNSGLYSLKLAITFSVTNRVSPLTFPCLPFSSLPSFLCALPVKQEEMEALFGDSWLALFTGIDFSSLSRPRCLGHPLTGTSSHAAVEAQIGTWE